MIALVKRTRIVFLATLAGMSLFLFFGVFEPMRSELSRSIYQNITEISKSKFSSFQNIVTGDIQGSVGLSSRTMIKNKIEDYDQGLIGMNELKEYTDPKYSDGASVLENIVSAQRMVDDQIIAAYSKADNAVNVPLDGIMQYNQLFYDFMIIGGDTFLRVSSPISVEGKILGVDIVIFDLTKKINELNNETYTSQIISQAEYEKIAEGSGIVDTAESALLLNQGDFIYFIEPAGDSNYFMVKVNGQNAFFQLNSLVINILISYLIVFAGLYFTVYFCIIRYANNRISSAEKSRDEFQSLVYKDKMTGLYTKAYLEYWKSNLCQIHSKCSLVMIDIDNFKMINDGNGHLSGDDVIKTVSEVFRSSVRETDIVIRFGGDEFLILLTDTDEIKALDIMKNISLKLDGIKDYGFKISISYGIGIIESGADFNSALQLAYDRMYEEKSKRSIDWLRILG
jgi:diguanylate cyclase (GGDEF)-like protein